MLCSCIVLQVPLKIVFNCHTFGHDFIKMIFKTCCSMSF
ncbi:hypothetical protein LOK49_Contig142G00006 [Camellia lanceoleosa]|nr:hypothetical protein LOK49_Contig142G00006 [Camellia lanceoleosa]